MKVIKLISNKAAKIIKEKHTKEEIENGVASVVQLSQEVFEYNLWEKLMEEVAEAINPKSIEELDDVMEVCRALKGEETKFSERWALVTARGHYKNEK